MLTDGWQFTVQNLDQLYVLVSSAHKTTQHDLTHMYSVASNVKPEINKQIIIMYLYTAQYLHILQDSKRYLTNPTVQVQPQLTSN